VMRWNRSATQLMPLETVGVFAGLACLIACGQMIWRYRPGSQAHRAPAPADAALVTLIAMEIVSGLVLAVWYRWASSWSVVTLTPYVASVMNLGPRVELVARMPFMVRLHVVCTFSIVAVLPFTTLGLMAVTAMWRVAAKTTAPVARVSRLVGAVAGKWIVRGVRPPLSWSDEES
jgi:nitrate reductase gamma subunit